MGSKGKRPVSGKEPDRPWVRHRLFCRSLKAQGGSIPGASLGPRRAFSRSNAAMGSERSHVRGLVQEPGTFPLVAGLSEILRIDQELFNPPWLVRCIMRQGDRCASLEYREGCDHDRQGRQEFPHRGGSSRRRESKRIGPPEHPCTGPIRRPVSGITPDLEPESGRVAASAERILVRVTVVGSSNLDQTLRDRRRLASPSSTVLNRERTSRVEARLSRRRSRHSVRSPNRQIRCYHHRHQNPLPIKEDSPDSSF